jgi:phage baseplate assembly protein W
LIIEEPVVLGSDRRSMVTSCPVVSTNSVRVLINDSFFVPSSGLHEQAVLSAVQRGPYRIPECDRTLTVASSRGTVTLPLPPVITATNLARLIIAALPTVSATVVDGRLVLQDLGDVGSASYIRLSGQATSYVGFTQRGANGTTSYPGWTILGDPNIARYPVFNAPIPNSPSIKVTYATQPNRCKRCVSTYVENDWQYNLQGDALMVVDEDLLVQSCLKVVLTRLGSNVYHPSYGTTVMDRIGSKATSTTAALIAQEVRAALSLVLSSQAQQVRFQQVTAKERLYAIRSVDVTQSKDDPTMFMVDVTVSNASNEPISVSVVYTAPGAVALQGTNGLSLGLR